MARPTPFLLRARAHTSLLARRQPIFPLLAVQAASLQAEKAALIPKRFGDDSDSDIDLDGL